MCGTELGLSSYAPDTKILVLSYEGPYDMCGIRLGVLSYALASLPNHTQQKKAVRTVAIHLVLGFGVWY